MDYRIARQDQKRERRYELDNIPADATCEYYTQNGPCVRPAAAYDTKQGEYCCMAHGPDAHFEQNTDAATIWKVIEMAGLSITTHSTGAEYGWGYAWPDGNWEGLFPTPLEALHAALRRANRIQIEHRECE